MPESAVTRAKALFGRPAAQGELAVLVLDSLLEQGDPAVDHRLRFEHPRLAIEVHISASTSGSDLTGQVEPAGSLQVRLEQLDSDVRVEDATGGAFAFPKISHGIARLHLTGATPVSAIHTDWFRV